MKCTFTLLACWLLYFQTEGQGPNKYFKQYLKEEKTLENINFHLLQDSRGFLWISGAGGVTRFDSHLFKSATHTHTGLASIGNVKAMEDKTGNIWFVGFSGRLSIMRGKRFSAYTYNSMVDKHLAWDNCTSIYMDNEETLHFGTFRSGYFQVTRGGVMSFKANKETHKPGVYLTYIENTPFVFSIAKPKEDTSIAVYRMEDDQNPIKLGEFGDLASGSSSNRSRFIERKDGSVWITKYDKLIRINQSKMDVLNAPFPINFLSEDQDGNIWYSNSKAKGIWCAEGDNFDDWNHTQYLSNASVNYMIQDRQRGYWFATESKGLFYSPSFWNVEISVNTEAEPSKTIGGINIPLLDMWYRKGRNGRFYGCTKEGKSFQFTLPNEPKNIGEIVVDTHNYRLLICADNRLFSIKHDDTRELKLGREPPNTVRSISILSDTSFCVSAGTRLHFFENDSCVNVSSTCPFEILETLADGETIYAGTIGSLFTFKNETWHDMRDLGDRTIGSIYHMRKYNGDIWIFNSDYGSAYLTPQNQLINFDDAECSVIKGVAGTSVNNGKLRMVGFDGRLLTATPKRDEMGYDLQLFPSPNYLRNDFIHKIGNFNNQIVYSSLDAAYFLKENLDSKSPEIEMVIDAVRVNNRSYFGKKSFILPHDSNAIEIGFVGMSYHSNGPRLYRYYMSGVEPYTETTKNTLRYTTLQPGDYSFNIYAVNNYSQQSEIETIAFKILPPFHLTWWFITLEFLFGLALIGLLVKVRISQIKRRSRLIEELHMSQHQALSARLNPHFLFNSLSSIYHFTLKNDKERAAEYMSEYARLMRLVLDNSGQNLVPLRSEIEAIAIYLELEKLRCKDRFNYTISISDNVSEQDIVIPSLMVQPYLENAIWHGLMPKEGNEGKLAISIQSQNERTIIKIEDNGIGRVKSKRLATTNHPEFESKGMEMHHKRIELLNKLYKVDFKVDILDLKQGDVGTGTCVILDLPTL